MNNLGIVPFVFHVYLVLATDAAHTHRTESTNRGGTEPFSSGQPLAVVRSRSIIDGGRAKIRIPGSDKQASFDAPREGIYGFRVEKVAGRELSLNVTLDATELEVLIFGGKRYRRTKEYYLSKGER